MEDHIRQCMAESGAEAFLAIPGRHSLQHVACQSAGNGLRGRIFARARPSLSRARRGYRGAAVRHPSASVQPARRGRRTQRRDAIRGGRLGSRSRGHAPLAGSFRGPCGGPVDGTAHSGWQFESLPPAPGGFAAGQDPAHRALRRAGRDRALHHQALHQPQGGHERRRVAARTDPAGAAEPRIRSVGRGSGRLRRRRRMAARDR